MAVGREQTRELVEHALLSARAGQTGWLRATCPLCPLRLGKPDRRGSLGVRVNDGYFHCFKCGAKGFVRSGVLDDPKRRRGPAEPQKPSLEATQPPPGFTLLAEGDGATAYTFRAARRYLASRSVTRRCAREAHIGACAKGKRRGRIIVPILGVDGAWCGWVGRIWRGGPLRLPYYYPSGMPRRELLWNHDALTVETDVPALVVEGVFDGLPYWPHAVAALGKDTSEQHVEALVSSRRPVCVVLDGDAWEQGRALAWRLEFEARLRVERGEPAARVGFVKLPPCTDPNDREVMPWLLEEAKRAVAA